MAKKQEIGLVFAGGGAKGAYQMGVWKAIRHYGLEPSITAVSGTSIGAMNAYLYASGEIDKGFALWNGIRKEDILDFDPGAIIDRLKDGYRKWREGRHIQASRILTLFSREKLVGMLESVITDPALPQSTIDCYATTYCGEKEQGQSFRLNGMSKQDAVTILTATSAIPGVYDSVEMNGHHYYDGGMAENVPISPLYQSGYRDILVVYLAKRDYVDRSRFPGARIVEIIPSEDLGDFFTGTLNFRPDAINGHQEQGYRDAKAIFSRYRSLDEMMEGESGITTIDREPILKKRAKALLEETVKVIVK